MFIYLITISFFSCNLSNFYWDLISVYKYLAEKCKADRARHFSVVPCDRTRGIEYKLRESPSDWGALFNSEDDWSCSRKLWALPAWRYSKAMGMWSWATSSRWPCWSCLALDDLQWSSQPTPFWDSIKAIYSNSFVLNCSFLSQSHNFHINFVSHKFLWITF